MEILLYYSTDNITGDTLRGIVEKFIGHVRISIFRNWNIFSKALLSPRDNTSIAVILISQREELLDAVSIRDLIHEYRLVLILPDKEEDIVSLGHTLRPNFMTYKMGDFQELEIVLKKMLRLGS